MRYTNDFKRKVIEEDILNIVKRIRNDKLNEEYESYLIDRREPNGELIYVGTFNRWTKTKERLQRIKVFDCAFKMEEARWKKTKRVRKKIEKMVLGGNALFVTLTFTDSTFKKTSIETRRRYVSRYLKENCKKYVANVDFGTQNEREHYHAVVDSSINLKNWHKYGAINVEHIHTTDNDLKRVSKYINKLTNHALKVGEDAPRLIYSRRTI